MATPCKRVKKLSIFEDDPEKFWVDLNKYGNPIDTDILIQGYIRQVIEMIYAMLIPDDIKRLCFDYWYFEAYFHGIKQFWVDVEQECYKLATIVDLSELIDDQIQLIIFVTKKTKAMWLIDKMKQFDVAVSYLDEELSKDENELEMKQFKSGETRALILTDNILSLCIDKISYTPTISYTVINYDLPISEESYIDRNGRRNRYGKIGYTINFVVMCEMEQLTEFKTFLLKWHGINITELPADLDSISVNSE